MVVVVLPTPPFWLAMAMIRGVAFWPPVAAVALVIVRTEYPQLSQGWGMMFHVEHSRFGAGLVVEGVVNVPRGTLPLVPAVQGWTRQTSPG